MAAKATVDSPPHRIEYVDGLRAVAVLLVVMFHAAKWDGSLGRGPLEHIFYEGAHGVDLFFVLSGFCLAYPTLRKIRAGEPTGFDIARYWAHRLTRILPPFYVALVLLASGGAVLTHFALSTPAPAWVAPTSLVDVLRQMLFLDSAGSWTNGSFWSLAVEFRWYFFFPFALWLWVRSPRAFLVTAVASLAAYHFTLLKAWDFATLPAFMLGIVAADLGLRRLASWRWALPALLVCIGASVVMEPRVPEAFAYQPQTGWQLASFFFVATVSSVPALRAILAVRPLVAVGLASYSVYLMHEPVIAWIESNATVGPIVAAIAAIAIGMSLWVLFERSTTQGDIRRRLLPRLDIIVRGALRWFGLPESIARLEPGVGEALPTEGFGASGAAPVIVEPAGIL